MFKSLAWPTQTEYLCLKLSQLTNQPGQLEAKPEVAREGAVDGRKIAAKHVGVFVTNPDQTRWGGFPVTVISTATTMLEGGEVGPTQRAIGEKDLLFKLGTAACALLQDVSAEKLT